MDLLEVLSEMKKLLPEIESIDLGYPLGQNLVNPPEDQSILQDISKEMDSPLPPSIVQFYTLCDGISLPDVYVGYFIHRTSLIKKGIERGEPVEISGNPSGKILVFGTDGGGGRFAIRLAHSQQGLYLPLGTVHNSIYEGENSEILILSEDFTSFLFRLLSDVKAFIEGNQGWKYMV